jgi:outer membrane protein
MRRATLLVLAITALVLSSTTAMAASLGHRLGLTGKLGALVPLQDDFISSTSNATTSFVGGGGLIYGFSKNFAGEIEVMHAPQLDVDVSGGRAYEATLTDISVGGQYRFMSEDRLVPFVGLGADFIKGKLEHSATGAKYDLDWTVGGHVSAGLDYFLNRGIALSAEGRFVFGAEGDVKSGGNKVGEYDPMNFQATVGFKLILPESAFW